MDLFISGKLGHQEVIFSVEEQTHKTDSVSSANTETPGMDDNSVVRQEAHNTGKNKHFCPQTPKFSN